MHVPDPQSVRSKLNHPIVDSDGHVVESLPAITEYMRRIGGSAVADRFIGSSPTYSSRQSPLLDRLDPQHPRTMRRAIPAWWTLPADTRDRATGFLPRLMHERLDELGIDFTVLYPSVGLTCMGHPDEAIRTVACRAVNEYLADALEGLADRMAAVAVIPTHTPEEAMSELDHAVGQLGFKAVMVNSYVARPLPEAGPGAQWLDVLGLDSAHDYDPVWARCVDLGVAATVHAPTMGVELRQSSTRYMYNHIGTFAASADAFAKAVFFGGVTRRFPTLNFGFMECGVSWGVQLLCDLISRWEKRGGRHIDKLDPDRVDAGQWDDLLLRYGGELFADPSLRDAMRGQSDNPPVETDDFRACGIEASEDIVAQFDRFFFGCEADEATISWAFARGVNPHGAVLQPVLGSDLGHWDVADMRGVVPEAYELVEHGQLDAAQFQAFACDNAIRLHGGMNAAFFEGTPLADYARRTLAGEPGNGHRVGDSSPTA
jgi:predicted TIM-barrel fold metal-dependent hydrolase